MLKKFFLSVLAVSCGFLIFLLSACVSTKDAEVVTLFAIDGTAVGVAEADYYVVAEPAASTRVAAMKGVEFSGNLQSLYGEDGYPQAVIVAKNEIVESFAISEFLEKVKESKTWLLSDEANITAASKAISACLPTDTTPVFNAKNLNATVVQNCGINFLTAQKSKDFVNEYIDGVNEVSSVKYPKASDGFFFDGKVSENKYDGKINVYTPDGAPALGISNLIAGETTSFEAEYHVVSATTIQTFVTGKTPAADICVLPVTAAVKLLGEGTAYKMVGTLTCGNLFLLSSGKEEITKDKVKSLKGKKVAVVNLAAVPGLTFKIILKKYGVEFVEA